MHSIKKPHKHLHAPHVFHQPEIVQKTRTIIEEKSRPAKHLMKLRFVAMLHTSYPIIETWNINIVNLWPWNFIKRFVLYLNLLLALAASPHCSSALKMENCLLHKSFSYVCTSNLNRFSACPLTPSASDADQLLSMWQHSPSLLKQVSMLPTGNGFWLLPGHCLKSTSCMDQSHPKQHAISMNSHSSVTTCALFSSLFSIIVIKKKGSVLRIF